MSQVNRDVDLAGLARTPSEIEPPQRGWMRILLPLAILAVFGGILWSTAWDAFADRPRVRLVRPERVLGGDAQRSRVPRLAVQAAGWVEPDPFPVYVSALAGGVVEEIRVQESDSVATGDVLATMVDDHPILVRDAAAAEVTRRQGALAAAEARSTIAVERFEAAIEVTEALERAEARTAGKAAELQHRRSAVAEGVAQVDLAASEIVVQRELDTAGAAGARQVEIAEAQLVGAEAKLEILHADVALVQAELEEQQAMRKRAQRDMQLRLKDRLEREVSAAEAERARGELSLSQTALAEAELHLARMSVASPASGVVLERLASPGENLAPGAPVASLYDPMSLRVRVDVPQSDIDKLQLGMTAEVQSEARPGRPYAAEILRIVQRADIQKVTLEVQVRILEADGLLRPDMLAQVRFLARPADEDPESSDGHEPDGPTSEVLSVPERFVEDGAVWVYDPVDRVARLRRVEVAEVLDGRAIVVTGLNLTDKLIDRGAADLEHGMRVDVRAGVDR